MCWDEGHLDDGSGGVAAPARVVFRTKAEAGAEAEAEVEAEVEAEAEAEAERPPGKGHGVHMGASGRRSALRLQGSAHSGELACVKEAPGPSTKAGADDGNVRGASLRVQGH